VERTGLMSVHEEISVCQGVGPADKKEIKSSAHIYDMG